MSNIPCAAIAPVKMTVCIAIGGCIILSLVILEMSLDDIPKKVQYIIVDSDFVNGTNNTFSLDLTLQSNTHVEDMSRVLGIKMVDFYITQMGATEKYKNRPS